MFNQVLKTVWSANCHTKKTYSVFVKCVLDLSAVSEISLQAIERSVKNYLVYWIRVARP